MSGDKLPNITEGDEHQTKHQESDDSLKHDIAPFANWLTPSNNNESIETEEHVSSRRKSRK
jgi:hypothetical protein